MRKTIASAAMPLALTVGALLAPTAAASASGQFEPAIVDGSYATSAPWAALVQRDGGQWCSGSIIASTWVLTAKHCVTAKAKYSVAVGQVDWQQGTSAKVTNVYTPASGDIALLRLDHAVSTTYAKLGGDPSAGATDEVYGWGYDQTGKLQQRLKVARMTVTSVTSGQIHSRRVDGRTAGGDSGGPVFVNGVQVGVHTNGDGKEKATHTSIQSQRAWIKKTSGV